MPDDRQKNGTGYGIYLYASFAILLLISGCVNTAVLLDTNILTADKINNVEAAKQKLKFLAPRCQEFRNLRMGLSVIMLAYPAASCGECACNRFQHAAV